MNFNAIVNRIQNLLLKPAEEWAKIKGEQDTVQKLFVPVAVFLAAIPAVAAFLGWLFFTGFHFFGYAFFLLIYRFIILLLLMFVTGLVIFALAPTFSAKKDRLLSMKLGVYTYVPLCILGILFIFPILWWFIWTLSLYGIYLFYIGTKVVLDTPEEKRVPYTVVVGVVYLICITLSYWSGTWFWRPLFFHF